MINLFNSYESCLLFKRVFVLVVETKAFPGFSCKPMLTFTNLSNFVCLGGETRCRSFLPASYCQVSLVHGCLAAGLMLFSTISYCVFIRRFVLYMLDTEVPAWGA